jgi:hypothetical protein
MFTTPILEEKLRVQAELSAQCRNMADYFAHNESAARALAAEKGLVLRYQTPEGFPPESQPTLVLKEEPPKSNKSITRETR